MDLPGLLLPGFDGGRPGRGGSGFGRALARRRSTQPSMFLCFSRATASATAGTSLVMVEPAATKASSAIRSGATRFALQPMKARGSDLGAVLGDAVVVHDDRAAAEAGALAHVGVADVREMIGLHAVAEHAVLDLDEVPDPDGASQARAGPQVGVGADHGVIPDFARLDHAAGLQMHPLSDARGALDHAARFDHGVAPDLHVHVDPGRSRIDDRDTGEHQLVQLALAERRGGARELGPLVDADRLGAVRDQERLDPEPLAHGDLDDGR